MKISEITPAGVTAGLVMALIIVLFGNSVERSVERQNTQIGQRLPSEKNDYFKNMEHCLIREMENGGFWIRPKDLNLGDPNGTIPYLVEGLRFLKSQGYDVVSIQTVPLCLP